MSIQTITNPSLVGIDADDYRLLRGNNGAGFPIGSRKEPYYVVATVTKGDIVVITPPASATAKPGVSPRTAVKYSATVGVATKTVAAGGIVDVVTWGLAFVQVNAGAPAAGDNAIIAADNECDVLTTEVVAATIVGTVLGVFLGAKDAANLAPVFVNMR